MLKSSTSIQNLENKSITINEYEAEHPTRLVSDYIEKIKSADVEQIKIYLGFLYFAVLLFFSFTLFL